MPWKEAKYKIGYLPIYREFMFLKHLPSKALFQMMKLQLRAMFALKSSVQ